VTQFVGLGSGQTDKGTIMKTVQKLSGNSMSESYAPGNLPIPAMQPTEHHLDEDATSRMDDEGGSQVPATEPPAAVKQADGC